MSDKTKLAAAVIKVMQAVQGMEKNSHVGTGQSSYSGVKDQDVKEVFNKSMSENGLCILPISVDDHVQIDRWEEIDPYSKEIPKGTKTKQSVFTTVKTKYLLLHTSGESMELAGYGHGIDSQDKGAGKATTYALKYCLLYTFLTPVGKIDDADSHHSDEAKTPPAKTTPPATKTPAAPPKEIPTLTDANYQIALKSDIKGINAVLNAIKVKKTLIATAEQIIMLENKERDLQRDNAANEPPK